VTGKDIRQEDDKLLVVWDSRHRRLLRQAYLEGKRAGKHEERTQWNARFLMMAGTAGYSKV
jgi:hypothetical protein